MTQANYNDNYLWAPPSVQSLPVRGSEQRLPVNRLAQSPALLMRMRSNSPALSASSRAVPSL